MIQTHVETLHPVIGARMAAGPTANTTPTSTLNTMQAARLIHWAWLPR